MMVTLRRMWLNKRMIKSLKQRSAIGMFCDDQCLMKSKEDFYKALIRLARVYGSEYSAINNKQTTYANKVFS